MRERSESYSLMNQISNALEGCRKTLTPLKLLQYLVALRHFWSRRLRFGLERGPSLIICLLFCLLSIDRRSGPLLHDSRGAREHCGPDTWAGSGGVAGGKRQQLGSSGLGGSGIER